MGQKVNPHGMRVGVIKDWDSRWYAEADFADNLVEDHKIRTYLKKKLYSAGVSKIEIERASDRVKVVIYTAKPGVVIGKGHDLQTCQHAHPHDVIGGRVVIPAGGQTGVDVQVVVIAAHSRRLSSRASS